MKKNNVITEYEEFDCRDELGLYNYTYYIDEEHRIITCISSLAFSYDCGILNELCSMTGVQKLDDYNQKERKRIAFILPSLNMNYQKLVGVAKCNPEDKWNVEIGKKVAKKKLMQKFHSMRLNILEIFFAHTQNIQNAIVKLANDEHMKLDKLKEK